MEKVKQSIKEFTHRAGHHDTTVHETVAPAVKHETVKTHEHENVNTLVDKEVHQDHYHHTVQPVVDKEVLPEQHTARLGQVQHHEFDHRDHDHTKRAIGEIQAGFKDERVVHDTTRSQSSAPVVGGEHVHHHIHETIQPVIEKEVIQPTVVHTTVPIHETHHKAAQHHSTSALPPVTLDEFKRKGGVLGGREERYDAFEGEPKNIGGALGGAAAGLAGNHHTGHHAHGDNHVHGDHHHAGAGVGAGGVAAGAGAAAAAHHRRRGSSSSSSSSDEEKRRTRGTAGRTTGTRTGKPSLIDKLNPTKDTDGDGKRGVLE